MGEVVLRLLKRPGLAFQLLFISALIAVLGLSSSVFVIQVLNRFVTHGIQSTLITLVVGVVLAMLMEFLLRRLRERLAAAVSAQSDARDADAVFAHLLAARQLALDSVPQGTRVEALRGLDAIQTAYGPSSIAAVLDVPSAALFVLAIWLLSPVLGGAVAIAAVAALVLGFVGGALVNGPSRRQAAMAGGTSSLIAGAFEAAETVRAFNGAGSLLRNWREQRHNGQEVRYKIGLSRGLANSATSLITGLATVAIIGVGAVLVVQGDLNIGSLIGCNLLAGRALQPFTRLAGLSETFARARQATRELANLVRLPREPASGSELRAFSGRLELRDLALVFQGGSGPLFESVNLKLGPGELLVVTGGNGTGKSSLLRLVAALLEPTRGQILVEGVDLRQVHPGWWRRQLVYLPQEPSFLSLSIADNIKMLTPDLPDDALNQLLVRADLRAYLDKSPQGLSAVLRDHGRSLPVGIRKRMALARAMAADGRLVLLDEPTEGLDLAGRRAIYQAINQFAAAGKTMVVVTHDPVITNVAHWLVDLDTKPEPTLTAQRPPPGTASGAGASTQLAPPQSTQAAP
jgi:ATP-binding cassette, subfamily C, bacterial LapB